MHERSRPPIVRGWRSTAMSRPEGFIKVTLRHAADDYDWPGLADQLGVHFGCEASLRVNANYAVIAVLADADSLGRVLAGLDPNLTIMSIGRSIEILKEIGAPDEIVERFGVRTMRGTHIIGAHAHGYRECGDHRRLPSFFHGHGPLLSTQRLPEQPQSAAHAPRAPRDRNPH